MNTLFFIRNPDLFQGEKYFCKNCDYFEGWYFKHTNGLQTISFIPGIQMNKENKKAFVQVITNDFSYYVNYDIADFHFQSNPFSITVGNSKFSKDKVHIDIKDDTQNIEIYGDLKYLDSKNIKTNFMNPNIMGPFSYVPFMECNHAILSMQNKIEGFINIKHQTIDFHNGTGYIEKDWGVSFPKSYIWCQGNCFSKKDASFMISIANIPFGLFSFRGLICVLILDHQEYKFTTYNCSRIIRYSVKNSSFDITLKKGFYELNVQSKCKESFGLVAPVHGEMKKGILESVTAFATVTLKKGKDILFTDTSTNCGLEIVLK